MNARTVISAKGQVVIPKELRDRLNLPVGQTLDVVEMGDGVLLRPVRKKSGRTTDEILDHLGSTVRYDGPPVSIEDMDDVIAASWRGAAADSDA